MRESAEDVAQYAFFSAYPVVNEDDYHWDEGTAGLTFVSVWIALALCVTPQLEKNYRARMAAKGGQEEPEDWLMGMMVGAVWVPISVFIFSSTSSLYVAPGGGSWVRTSSSTENRERKPYGSAPRS